MIENDEQVKETIIENLDMYQKSEDAKNLWQVFFCRKSNIS